MEPQNSLSPQLQAPDSGRPPYALYAMVAIGLIFIALIGWIVWRSYRASPAAPLHVVSSNPALNKVTTITPFVKLSFNKPLVSTGLSVTSSPGVIASDSVSGQILTINLKTPTDTSKTYTITLESVSDTTGGQVTNEKFMFKPVVSATGAIPNDQVQALVQQQGQAQATAPYGLENINFSNFDDLVDGNDSGTFGGGLTADEESNVEYAFFQFGSSQTPKTSSFTLDPNSINAPPRDPNSTSTVFTIYFNVTADSTVYKARMDYHDGSNARLYLYNAQSGAQVFDSGDVNVDN